MKISEDLVSIIMPNRNNAEFIGCAIESVIGQTYKNWELLIVDDCSTDNSEEIIKKYTEKDARIRFFKHEKHMNAANARNTGLSHAKGRYAAFLDSDDFWEKEKLEKQIAFMKKNDIDFCCHAYKKISSEQKISDKAIIPPKKTDYYSCLEKSNPIGNLTAIYDMKKLGIIYSPDIDRRNDFAMWLQVLKKTKYCYGMNEVLAYYRTGVAHSVSRNKVRLIIYHWKLYREVEGFGIIKSIHYMFCWILAKFFKVKC